jgi:gamma-glutamyltranspeptidase/glutathione hydrolase
MKHTHWMRSALAAGLALVVSTASGVQTQTPPKARTKNPQVVALKGMVASAHPLASQAGVEILKAGGNAVDAAVAAAFTLGVVEPNASGIGGEGMMIVYLARRGVAIAIDYRSTAPATAKYDKTVPALGHQSVAVPGTVAGLTLALEKYGTLKLPTVMMPAIHLAAEGFKISETLGTAITDHLVDLSAREPAARLFTADGLPLEAGALLRNPDLAASLRKISAGGRDAFYRGELAGAIASEMAAQGGFVTRKDLEGYQAIERVPVKGSYRGYTIYSAPPPVAGVSMLEMLQILENFPVATYPAQSVTRVHVAAEAMRRGDADMRAFVGDPGFVTVPVDWLLSKPYAKSRASEIKLDAISTTIAAGEPSKEPASTTSLSVVDKDGNMVALTQTISDYFGSTVVVAGTGILLNNEMKNFSRTGPNVMAPGKRMRTTIAPSIMLTPAGKTFATLGTPGAARILTTMTLLVQNLVDYKMGIQEAIEAPRFFPEPGGLAIEPRLPAATTAGLTKMGYVLRPLLEFDPFFGGAQGIIIDPATGRRIGGADPRRDGTVIGY